MLSFEEYSQQTHRTAAYPEDQAELYLALGIADEAGELFDALTTKTINGQRREKITAEMGDVYWYVSELSRQLDVTANGFDHYQTGMDLEEGKDRVELALRYACQIAGQAKKALRDDGGEFTDSRARRIKSMLTDVRNNLRSAAHHLGLGGEEVVLTRNAEKLSIRDEEGLIQGEGEGDERVNTA